MAEENTQTDSTNLEQTTDTTATDPVDPVAAADPLDQASILGDVKDGDVKDGEVAKDDAPALHGEAPETYELKAPEGRTLDAEGMKLFTDTFKKLGLTNDGAQVLIDPAFDFVDRVTEQTQNAMMAQVAETRANWAKESEADAEIGGANFEKSKALCGRMFDKFGWKDGGAFRTFLNDTGMGNHPEMIRAMVKVAQATGEDSFERGDSSKGEVPVWDRVYGAPASE